MVDRTSIRILSLDGGSLAHAAVPLFVLSEIEQRLGCSITSLFDVVAGVGSSSFCAAGLVIPDEGGGLNTATDLSTFYLHQIKSFTKRRFFDQKGVKLDQKALEKPVFSFFKDSLLSDAKVELLLPMLDLQAGLIEPVSSWRARNEPTQPNDFKVADLVARSMMQPTVKPTRPLVSTKGSKHLLSTAATVLGNPSQLLHSTVKGLCNSGTQIQLVSVNCGSGSLDVSFADIQTMEPEQYAAHLNAIGGSANAQEVDQWFTSQIAEGDLPNTTYGRLAYDAPELSQIPYHKIDMKVLTRARHRISTEVQKLDLGFLQS